MKPLLILVDLQQDYLKSPDLTPTAASVVNGAAALLSLCRSRGIPVVHLWTTVSRNPDNRMPHWKQADVWQCEEGTPGHEPPPALAPLADEPVIHKTGFSAPQISGLARGINSDTVIVAGVKTHACVRQVVLDAWQAELAVLVAADAIASDDPLHAAITRRYLAARGVAFLNNRELVTRLCGNDGKAAHEVRSPCGPAIAAARNRFTTWRETSMAERVQCLRRLAMVLDAQISPLARLMAQEIGKPVRFCKDEVRLSVEMLEAIAGRAERHLEAPQESSDFAERRCPHGVVAAITPWNNPVSVPLGKMSPAIIYGNAVVWKPAPEALAVSRRLLQCLGTAEWPEGLVSLLEGGEQEAVSLMSDDAVAAVTLTGSSAAGFVAQEVCARRRIPLQAELGGNNAAIVWSDADLSLAARSVAHGAFEMAGQRCTANRRVVVHVACREEFIQRLREASAALKWGDPLNSDTDIGPLVSTSHRDRVAGYVERAASECGAPLLPLGDTPPSVEDHAGKFYPPTILSCEDPAAEIVQEETFGPVLVVQTMHDWGSAIALCNGVRQGLVAAIFTTSRDIVRRFLGEAEAGILKIDQSTAGAAVDVPFGAWKASGVGLPEHGRFDIEFFTRPQSVYEER